MYISYIGKRNTISSECETVVIVSTMCLSCTQISENDLFNIYTHLMLEWCFINYIQKAVYKWSLSIWCNLHPISKLTVVNS